VRQKMFGGTTFWTRSSGISVQKHVLIGSYDAIIKGNGRKYECIIKHEEDKWKGIEIKHEWDVEINSNI
jgi:hypothetical protein